MSTIPNAPAAVKATFSDASAICPHCATGCGRCRGSGLVAVPPQLDSVECPCGWACTGDEWMAQDSPLCPRCGVDLESAINAQWPEEVERDFDGSEGEL